MKLSSTQRLFLSLLGFLWLSLAHSSSSLTASPSTGRLSDAIATTANTQTSPNHPKPLLTVDPVLALVREARRLGPVGNDRTEAEKEALLRQAQDVTRARAAYAQQQQQQQDEPQQPHDPQQQQLLDLTGPWERLYSVSPGKKKGRIRQDFVNATHFVNKVILPGGWRKMPPLLTMEIGAQLVLPDHNNQQEDDSDTDSDTTKPNSSTLVATVQFETIIRYKLFGRIPFRQKVLPQAAVGTWTILFVGDFVDDDGRRKRLRVMETPSLFVLLQEE